MEFRSAKDGVLNRLVTILRLIVTIIFTLLSFLMMFDVISFKQHYHFLIILGFFIFFTSILARDIRYVINGNKLRVIGGFYDISIHISQIKAINRNNRSSYIYCQSFDYFSLEYGKEKINISPENKKGFIEALLAKNPNILVEIKV